jgi:hypothetical protein
MEMWQKATDMKIPLHDDFKIHFMENRRTLLAGLIKTRQAWMAVLQAMTSTFQADELDVVRGEVKAFVDWVERGLAELAALRE